MSSEERTDSIFIDKKLYLRCDSIFAPMSGVPPKQCIRIRDHEGHHCDEDGKQWKP